MIPDRRAALRTIVALGAVPTLAACAEIPMESPVRSGGGSAGASGSAPYVLPAPPPADAEPEEIVRGFLEAGVGDTDGFAVAREYLTGDFSTSWNPRTGVLVYSAEQDFQVTATSSGSVSVTLHRQAAVDERGRYSSADEDVTLRFSLRQVDGEWRIARASDGVAVSSSAFHLLYPASTVYFPAQDAAYLVPEVRWFSSDRQLDGIVGAVLGGPSGWLAAAVLHEVPDDVGLQDDLPQADPDSALTVTLTHQALDLDRSARALLAASLSESLLATGGMNSVVVRADDVLLATSAELDALDLRRPTPGQQAIAAGSTGIVRLGERGTRDAGDQVCPQLASRKVRHPARSRTSAAVAALSSDFTQLLVGSTDGSIPLTAPLTSSSLVAPTIDRFGIVWTSDASADGRLLGVRAADGGSVEVDAAWLRDREVLGIDVAADGARVVIVSAAADGSRADLAAIERDAHGAPRRIGDPETVATGLDGIDELHWYSETSLIGLGHVSTEDEAIGVIADGADASEGIEGTPAGAVSIAGSSLTPIVHVCTDSGVLYTRRGTDWAQTGTDVRDPRFV